MRIAAAATVRAANAIDSSQDYPAPQI